MIEDNVVVENEELETDAVEVDMSDDGDFEVEVEDDTPEEDKVMFYFVFTGDKFPEWVDDRFSKLIIN